MPNYRLKKIRKELKLTQQDMGKPLGLSQSNIRDIESGKVKFSTLHALAIENIFKVNSNWLLTGEGHPYIIGGENSVEKSETDPEVADLLNMTARIIKSDTGYARSLKANIRSFHDAVETQSRLDKLEQRISEMEKDRSGNENGGCPPGASPAPKIQSRPGRKTGT